MELSQQYSKKSHQFSDAVTIVEDYINTNLHAELVFIFFIFHFWNNYLL